jgi:hypothetical protein
MENIKLVNTQQGRQIYHWKNLKKKSYKIKRSIQKQLMYTVHCAHLLVEITAKHVLFRPT